MIDINWPPFVVPTEDDDAQSNEVINIDGEQEVHVLLKHI